MKGSGIYDFVYRGRLTEAALERTQARRRIGFTREEEQLIGQKLSLDVIDSDLVESARKMAIVYTAIASLENSIRSFVSKILLDKFAENWWEEAVTEGIRKRADSRQDEEKSIRWHSQRGNNPLYFTEFGDFVSIMQSNWSLFEPHLISVEWARNIIKTLERSRNVIMHSGELSNTDIERIGTAIRDWIAQVGI